ncbi:glycosyltransferase [Tumidithrix elongata RA019]|uniref:Glycosyltransferase n=1 Tax=Tumidithrix elongata BACA0141 TaxID=2716417 RepID=A0AAW9Q4S1_9CYAN|nr:glycosyltransferase [Tumidithrix elongata RA019]
MLITMLAAGTRGDTQPYIALGLALKAAGYTVRIAASETFQSFVEGFGLEFYPLQGDVSKVSTDSHLKKAMQADNPLKIVMSFKVLREYAFSLQKGFYDACQGADAIVYHPGAAIGYFIAQALNIPSILATPFPMTPTKDYPALIFYDSVRLGKTFNLLTHILFEQTMWLVSSLPIQQFWKQEFGSVPPNFTNPFRAIREKNALTIVSCSNYVFPEPKDWPDRVHNTGYWFVDEEHNWTPSDELQDFLQSGTPPVYVGFGSLGDPDRATQTTELVIDALNRSGQRGVLATGWSGMAKLDRIPENIFILDSAPHAWLFPRMSAVVHHGGAGTTAAGLRAGVPSILIPHANDQFAWGRRVYELGVGAKPIPRQKLTAAKLSEAIMQALTPEVKLAAKALGARIQSEHGSETAAKAIAHYLEQQ